MRILIAPDKFKGSLGAEEVGARIAAGLHAVLPQAEIKILAVADGGEGTAAVICRAREGKWVECDAQDALGRSRQVRYGWLGSSHTAVMEMSAAAGVAELAPNERNPLAASSFGVGQMLRDAAGRGAKQVLLGLGGSATNDGGFGLARALGFRFLGADGEELIGSVADAQYLARIDRPNELKLPPITAASDVRNPLLGPRGATRVFGAQKGATPAQVEILERALTRLADVAARSGRDLRDIAGAGAAGGLGFGLLTFCDAAMRPGFEVVAEAIGLRSEMARADFVITGEGKLDRQTLEGKAPAGVAKMARELGKPIFAIFGQATEEEEVRALFDHVLTLDDETAGYTRSAALLEARARRLASSWL